MLHLLYSKSNPMVAAAAAAAAPRPAARAVVASRCAATRRGARTGRCGVALQREAACGAEGDDDGELGMGLETNRLGLTWIWSEIGQKWGSL